MAGSAREEAQRRRAEARQRRRGQESPEPEQDREDASAPAGDSGGADEPLETMKQAAKVAAAAAAVGAAVGAARAMVGGDHEDRPAAEEEEGPAAEAENPEPVSEAREPEAAEEPQAEREESPEEQPEGEPEPEEEPEEEPEAKPDEQRPTAGAPAGDAREVVESAREQLATLLGSEPESVSSFERTNEGWKVTLEVVEVSRIPESTDVLASYELTLDGDRNLVRYHRARRYYRAQAGSQDGS